MQRKIHWLHIDPKAFPQNETHKAMQGNLSLLNAFSNCLLWVMEIYPEINEGLKVYLSKLFILQWVESFRVVKLKRERRSCLEGVLFEARVSDDSGHAYWWWLWTSCWWLSWLWTSFSPPVSEPSDYRGRIIEEERGQNQDHETVGTEESRAMEVFPVPTENAIPSPPQQPQEK